MEIQDNPPGERNADTADCARGSREGEAGSCAVALIADQPSRWRFAVPPALLLLIFLAFVPALAAGFVYWDDDDLLINTTRYQDLTWGNLQWMFTTSYTGHFQPLTWLSYWLDYNVWPLQPFGYHLTNVLLHAATALTFYFMTRMLLGVAAGSGAHTRSRSFVLAAGLASVLFAVHPLRAESVAWLAERRDVLSGFLYVLAVATYLRYSVNRSNEDIQSDGGSRIAWYIAAVACCLASLLAKASAMTLPLVLLVLDVYPLRRLGGANGWWRGSARRVWMEKLPFFFLAVAAGIRALIAQEEGGALRTFAGYDFLARIAQACYGLTFYIAKTVWPTNLGPLYEIPSFDILTGPRFVMSAAIVVCLGVFAVSVRRIWPALTAALVVYAITLAPVLGFAQSGPQLVADRYSYLSCMGLAVAVGAAVLWYLRSEWRAKRAHARAIVCLFAFASVTALEHSTLQQADKWKSALDLWRQGVRVSPDSAIANVNYADALATAQAYQLADKFYQHALAINPNDPIALHHYGDLLRIVGNSDLAAEYFLAALRIDPNRRRACFSLAQILVGKQRPRDAVVVLHDGIRRHPEAFEMIAYLASLLASHPDDNVRSAEEAVALASRLLETHNDQDVSALLTLASAFAETGRFDHAVETAEKALALAESAEADLLIRRAHRRLALFREGQPYRLIIRTRTSSLSPGAVPPDVSGQEEGATQEAIDPTGL